MSCCALGRPVWLQRWVGVREGEGLQGGGWAGAGAAVWEQPGAVCLGSLGVLVCTARLGHPGMRHAPP